MLYLLIIISVILYSSISLVKKDLQEKSKVSIAKELFALEYVGCTIFYLIYAAINNKLILPEAEYLPYLLLHAVIWGAFSYINLYSLKKLPASSVGIIESSRFIWILLASIFIFQESISVFDLAGLGLLIAVIYGSNKKLESEESSTKAIILTSFNATIIAAGYIIDKYLCAIGVPLETILISVCLLPSLFIVSLKSFSFKKTFQVVRQQNSSILLPLFESIAYMLIVYVFSQGGSLLTVSILAKSDIILLVLVEFFLFKSRKDFRSKLGFACLNILAISLILF